MENIIQQLKDNEKPFGRMSEEMQEKAEKIKIVNFVVFNDLCSFVGHAHVRFYYNQTYRLRADYENEPEIVEVRIIRGEGGFSPVSVSNISVHVQEFEGEQWVRLTSLEYAKQSIANAVYWLKKLGVWGDSSNVQKIYKLIHPERATWPKSAAAMAAEGKETRKW